MFYLVWTIQARLDRTHIMQLFRYNESKIYRIVKREDIMAIDCNLEGPPKDGEKMQMHPDWSL